MRLEKNSRQSPKDEIHPTTTALLTSILFYKTECAFPGLARATQT